MGEPLPLRQHQVGRAGIVYGSEPEQESAQEMPVSPEYKEFVRELLTPLGAITMKPFFGGFEVKYGEVQFAWVLNDTLYFKVDDGNRPDFEEAGVEPFAYERNGKAFTLRKLHEVPAFLFDEPDEMASWARKAIDAEMRSQKAKAKKGTRKKSGKTKAKSRAGKKTSKSGPGAARA